jgi:hypothetical protein
MKMVVTEHARRRFLERNIIEKAKNALLVPLEIAQRFTNIPKKEIRENQYYYGYDIDQNEFFVFQLNKGELKILTVYPLKEAARKGLIEMLKSEKVQRVCEKFPII